MVLTGSCHCGEVEYEIDVEAGEHILCHCSACKKIGGGEYTLNMIAPIEKCKVTKGELKVYTYKGDSGNPTHCYYCGNCTAHPWHHQTVQGPVYVVRTALLKDADKLPVSAEIYGKDRWSFQPEVAHTFELTPP
ncbi:hypothetical protein ABW19_dt0205202 [Dactylella cylindrospora]|nr:hypothetical protein ABW19_dt0205202 [Dactylella cylindrospora]